MRYDFSEICDSRRLAFLGASQSIPCDLATWQVVYLICSQISGSREFRSRGIYDILTSLCDVASADVIMSVGNFYMLIPGKDAPDSHKKPVKQPEKEKIKTT